MIHEFKIMYFLTKILSFFCDVSDSGKISPTIKGQKYTVEILMTLTFKSIHIQLEFQGYSKLVNFDKIGYGMGPRRSL